MSPPAPTASVTPHSIKIEKKNDDTYRVDLPASDIVLTNKVVNVRSVLLGTVWRVRETEAEPVRRVSTAGIRKSTRHAPKPDVMAPARTTKSVQLTVEALDASKAFVSVGCVATMPIAPGTILDEYRGVQITPEEVEKRRSEYVVWVDTDGGGYHLDGDPTQPEFAREQWSSAFFNYADSRTANAVFTTRLHKGAQRPLIVAFRKIEKGQEIRVDYDLGTTLPKETSMRSMMKTKYELSNDTLNDSSYLYLRYDTPNTVVQSVEKLRKSSESNEMMKKLRSRGSSQGGKGKLHFHREYRDSVPGHIELPNDVIYPSR